MYSKKSRITLAAALLISLSLACVVTGSEQTQEISSEDTVATAVAATIAANQADELPRIRSHLPNTQR